MQRQAAYFLLGAAALLPPLADIHAADDTIVLEPFPVEVRHQQLSDSISPLTGTASGLFGTETNPLEIPRSITIATDARLRLSGVDSFAELSEVSPGAERLSFWGIAGSPELRGTHAGVYYGGILRAYQRNEMPTSFASSEGLEIVRGPVPSQLASGPVGGYVNMVPKSPYFGKSRGFFGVTLGSWDDFRIQADEGGPAEAFGLPAAWRVSVSAKKSGSYYDSVSDDNLALYGTLKVQLDKSSTLSVSAEFHRHESSEIPGWNRVTQRLVDDAQYVIGESVDISDAAWGGANRDLVTKGYLTGIQDFSALVVPASTVDGAVNSGALARSVADAMLNLSDPDDLARAYGQPLPSTGARDPSYDASGNAALDAALGQAYAKAKASGASGYRYTRTYFENGGGVFTKQIDGGAVLSDKRDFADSSDGLLFINWKREYYSGAFLDARFLSERLSTRKHSTYGFALSSDQLVNDAKFSLGAPLEDMKSTATLGAELRYSWAVVTQDFFAEPFSRRDISLGTATDNSVVDAGNDIAPDGKNLWSPGRGANLECELYQASIFAAVESTPFERLHVYSGLRGEAAAWDTRLAKEVDRATPALLASSRHKAGTFFGNASIAPVYELSPNWRLYASAQAGTALAPGDAGTIVGRANFTKIQLLETGIKAALLDNRLFLSLSAYQWEQSRYSDIDARALPMRGTGVEAESTLELGSLSISASATFQRVRLLSDAIGYGAVPRSEEEWALSGGVLTAASDRSLPANPDRVYEGTPRASASIMADWKLPHGFGVAIGPHWRSSCYASMDRTVKLPESLVWNGVIHWRQGRWSASLRLRNFTDEVYYLASDPVFSGNALVTRAEPLNWELTVGYEF
ncbi:MAG TPA: hypothetical protein PKI32_01025 [Opitutales bacterium]|nr:hypothetical protein [Opitutales bacterium]